LFLVRVCARVGSNVALSTLESEACNRAQKFQLSLVCAVRVHLCGCVHACVCVCVFVCVCVCCGCLSVSVFCAFSLQWHACLKDMVLALTTTLGHMLGATI
jgi:hypothetical protein